MSITIRSGIPSWLAKIMPPTAPAEGTPEDLPNAFDGGEFDLMPEADEEDPSGADASAAERLSCRLSSS